MSDRSVTQRSVTALSWGAAGAIARVASQLIIQILLARLLDPHAFGQYALMLTAIGFGYLLAEGGFGAALIQKKILDNAHVESVLGWSLISSVVITLAVLVVSHWFPYENEGQNMVRVISVCALLIVPLTLNSLGTNLLRRDLRIKEAQLVQFFAYTFVFGGISITLAVLGMGVWSLVAGFFAQTIFSLIATYALARHSFRPRLQGDSKLFVFGFKSLGADLSNWSLENADRLLIGSFWGLPVLGLYSVAFNLTKAPCGVLLSTMQSVLFSATARIQENRETLRRVILVALSLTSLVTVPLFSMVALESMAVLDVIYGPRWVLAAPYMSALALAIPTMTLGTLLAAIMRGYGLVGMQLRIQVATALLLVVGIVAGRFVPLEQVIWVVPTAYLFRCATILWCLARTFEVRARDVLLSLRGAACLTAIAVGCVLAGRSLLGEGTSIPTEMGPFLVGIVGVALSLVKWRSWMLGGNVQSFFITRYANSRRAAALCKLVGQPVHGIVDGRGA